MKSKKFFFDILIKWDRNKNIRQMPWKGEKDPYKIWISEIILQQTRVQQGLEYYNRFIKTYPTVQLLASAKEQEVFKLWEGLGYYSRCKNLIASAKYINDHLGGRFPDKYEDILALKGIGTYTAAAIASFAFNQPYAVLDGNVFRVLARFFGIEIPVDSSEGKKLFSVLSQELIDKKNPAEFNQAIMDFGAVVCKPALPLCDECLFQKKCIAFQKGMINIIPIKEKSIKKRERFFNYLVIEENKKIYVAQRTNKDIWQNLYEFVLIETQELVGEKRLLQSKEIESLLKGHNYTINKISPILRQKLTHQTIIAKFFYITILKPGFSLEKYQAISIKELATLPFPKLINAYLKDKNVSLNLFNTNWFKKKYRIFMRGVNRVVLIGNLGKDPEIQYLEGNIPVAKFPLATTETYKDRAGKLISQTEWHNIVLWRGLAELAQKYLHKSSLVYIEGRLKTRSWEDREHNKKVATEIVGDNLIMLDKRTEGTQPGTDATNYIVPGSDIPPIDEGSEKLPF